MSRWADASTAAGLTSHWLAVSSHLDIMTDVTNEIFLFHLFRHKLYLIGFGLPEPMLATGFEAGVVGSPEKDIWRS